MPQSFISSIIVFVISIFSTLVGITFDNGGVSVDMVTVIAEYGQDGNASDDTIDVAAFPPTNTV